MHYSKIFKELKVKRIILIGEEFFKLRSSYKTFNFYKSSKIYINLMKKDLEYAKNIFVMGSRLNNLDKVIQTYMLSDYLYSFREIHFFFNLFNYISFRAGLSLVSSFILILIFMPYWIKNSKKIISIRPAN